MYTTCAFCSGEFAGTGGDSGLGTGRRFAFDPWKSRAWVICHKCGRWNLTPYDTRVDTISALDRMASAGRVAATTEQVSLIRLGEYDLVRVGKPPRIEYAHWRYGERLKARDRERLKVIVPASIVVVGGMLAFNAVVGGAMGGMVGNIPAMINGIYVGSVGRRQLGIELPVCARCGHPMNLRAKHIQNARLTHGTHADLALILTCPICKAPGAQIEGENAEKALRTGLTYVGLKKGRNQKKKARDAAVAVDRRGGPEEYLRQAARTEWEIKSLPGVDLLAVEMAVDEQMELRELERQWREADELAQIADNLLESRVLEERLRQLKGDQPDG